MGRDTFGMSTMADIRRANGARFHPNFGVISRQLKATLSCFLPKTTNKIVASPTSGGYALIHVVFARIPDANHWDGAALTST